MSNHDLLQTVRHRLEEIQKALPAELANFGFTTQLFEEQATTVGEELKQIIFAIDSRYVAFWLKDGTPIYHHYEDGYENDPLSYSYSFLPPDKQEEDEEEVWDIRYLENWKEIRYSSWEDFIEKVKVMVQEAVDDNLLEKDWGRP